MPTSGNKVEVKYLSSIADYTSISTKSSDCIYFVKPSAAELSSNPQLTSKIYVGNTLISETNPSIAGSNNDLFIFKFDLPASPESDSVTRPGSVELDLDSIQYVNLRDHSTYTSSVFEVLLKVYQYTRGDNNLDQCPIVKIQLGDQFMLDATCMFDLVSDNTNPPCNKRLTVNVTSLSNPTSTVNINIGSILFDASPAVALDHIDVELTCLIEDNVSNYSIDDAYIEGSYFAYKYDSSGSDTFISDEDIEEIIGTSLEYANGHYF